jgi:sugar phosphate isomerase/epimerase
MSKQTPSADLVRLTPLFDRFSLKPIAVHSSVSVLEEEGRAEEELGRAKESGIGYLVIPVLPQQMRGTIDDYRGFAERMNLFGEKCKAEGVVLAYHNHAFEFEPMEGTSPIETMLEAFEPGLVGLELDVFWSSVAGVDPVEILNRYPSQIPLLHLKDKAAGTSQTYDGNNVRPDQFKEVGSGVLDFAAILEAGDSNGVQHYVVEQDHCPGDPLESLRMSFDYLEDISRL